MPFRDAWLLVGGLLVVVGFGASEPTVSAVGLAVVVVGAAARSWSRHLFDRLSLRTKLSESRVFPGEEVTLDVDLENRKLLPLPWYEWRLGIADQFRVDGEALSSQVVPGLSWIYRRGAIGWYERHHWRFSLASDERGYHQVGPGAIRSADLFGLIPGSHSFPDVGHVVVYPRAFALGDLRLPADRPLGAYKGRNRLFEDPLRIAGLRDYRPGDPLKRIDWKATARRGELQSRVYDASADPQLYILMNIDTLEHAWEGYLKDDLERTISVAASVAIWAGEERFAVGLLANGSYPGADRHMRLAPSRARDQIARILEALAVIQPLTLGDLASTVRRESSRVPAGSTIVVVASLVPGSLAAAIQRLRAELHHVVVIGTSDRVDTSLLPGVPYVRWGPSFARRAGAPA